MTLADSNIWVALALAKHPFHFAARDWFARQKLPTAVLFCRVTQHSFLRLVTTSAVVAPFGLPPLTNQEARATYERFLADERISWVSEPRGVERHWKKFAGNAKPSPKLWMDGYLAAFALAGGYRLVTTDKAFKQFRGLDVVVLGRG
jgi:toxin-antitoxin system PIN domain toxin